MAIRIVIYGYFLCKFCCMVSEAIYSVTYYRNLYCYCKIWLSLALIFLGVFEVASMCINVGPARLFFLFLLNLKILSSQKRGGSRGVPFDSS
jgi:hypothetical protein